MSQFDIYPKTDLVRRENVLDFLRGLSVLLMILAHSIYFFHDNSSVFLRNFGRLGNTVCFSLFLFVAGASAYFAYIRTCDKRAKTNIFHILKKSGYLFLGYCLISFLALFSSPAIQSPQAIFSKIVEFIFWLNLPGFTEFLVPFIFFNLTIIIFFRLYKRVSKSIWLTLGLSVLVFVLGYILYPVKLAAPFSNIKAILVGEEGLYRYPIFQYWPLWFFGMYWGRLLEKHPSNLKRTGLCALWGLVSLAIFGGCFLLSNRYPLAILNPDNRWPPSVGFLSLGLSFGYLIQIIFFNFENLFGLRYFWRFLNYLGRDAFDLFIVHILLLYFYSVFWKTKYADVMLAILLSIVLLALSIIISSLNWKVSPSIFKLGPISFGKLKSYRPKKRHWLSAVAFIALIFLNAYRNQPANPFGATVSNAAIVGQEVAPLEYSGSSLDSVQPPKWFNPEYLYYRQVSLENHDNFLRISQNTTVVSTIKIDDPQSLEHLKSGEISLVYFYQDTFSLVGFSYEILDDGSVKLILEVQNDVYPQKVDNRYFLYYGSQTASDNVGVPALTSSFGNGTLLVGSEKSTPFLASVSRKWNLRSAPGNLGIEPLVFALQIGPVLAESVEDIYYEIAPSGQKALMNQVTPWRYESIFNPADFQTGKYQIKAGTKDGQYISQTLMFYVSEPVYVGWTIDWEGWDVADSYLVSIAQTAVLHNNLPITHFFNPRIYLDSAVSAPRAVVLTDWIKTRQEAGDEIDLHLHMHFDVVRAAGLEPKTAPNWGYRSSEGYDVYTTAYNAAEFDRLLVWAEDQFKTHELPLAKGFRAGGWFINSELLKVLENRGYSFDASGREHTLWNGKIISPWNLTSVTQPFFPSCSDQNISSQDNLNLLEIPNSGGDCSGYSAQEMQQKFYSNFNGDPVDQPKSVVFLSHAQFQNTDEQTIGQVLDATDKFLYQNDLGPVIYTTLGEINKIWR